MATSAVVKSGTRVRHESGNVGMAIALLWRIHEPRTCWIKMAAVQSSGKRGGCSTAGRHILHHFEVNTTRQTISEKNDCAIVADAWESQVGSRYRTVIPPALPA